jgi:dTDP-4-amino-4,6-dideoxygalactose transaminase
LDSTEFINGSAVQSFTAHLRDYLQVRHVIPCANGTDALQVAMMAMGYKEGDEIITSDFTFIATVETIALLGLKPVLVDADPDHFNIDPGSVENAITDRTRAIIPVHLYGQCAPMEELLSLARKHDLHIIEDTAQATGTDYTFSDGTTKKAGTLGSVGCTSFFPSKNLGAYGDGGALFTNDDALADRMNSIVNHGMKVRYYHDHVGVNSRLDSIQAAILQVKLKYLDEFNRARQEVASYYDTALSSLEVLNRPVRVPFSNHIFHQYTLKTNGIDRDSLMHAMGERGIPTNIYYPIPLHRQKAFKYLQYHDRDFPNTEDLCRKVLSLPIHTEMSEEQLEYITVNMKDIIKSHRL